LPKENPWQAVGGLKSLEGTDRNACASRAWKGGNMELGFWTAPFCDGAFLFPLAASFKRRRNFANSLRRIEFTRGQGSLCYFQSYRGAYYGKES